MAPSAAAINSDLSTTRKNPWQMKAVSERYHEIRQAHQAPETAGYDHADESCHHKVETLYADMRTTWEHVIEDILRSSIGP